MADRRCSPLAFVAGTGYIQIMVAIAMPSKGFGFSTRLRALRQAAGLTQQELADRSGVPLHSITKLEGGTHAPQWATAIKLARALGISLDQFVGEEKETAPSRPRGRPKRTAAEERARQAPPGEGEPRKGGAGPRTRTPD